MLLEVFMGLATTHAVDNDIFNNDNGVFAVKIESGLVYGSMKNSYNVDSRFVVQEFDLIGDERFKRTPILNNLDINLFLGLSTGYAWKESEKNPDFIAIGKGDENTFVPIAGASIEYNFSGALDGVFVRTNIFGTAANVGVGYTYHIDDAIFAGVF